MSIGTGVVRAVALQQIDNAPNAEARAQRDNKGLQSGDSGCEECHIVLHFSGIFPGIKKCLRHLNPLAPIHGGIRGSFFYRFPA